MGGYAPEIGLSDREFYRGYGSTGGQIVEAATTLKGYVEGLRCRVRLEYRGCRRHNNCFTCPFPDCGVK